MEKNEKRVRSGFTMAELLIVVAIIAVLTAIAIPVFSGQLEKSREATDLANLRSAYAEVASEALLNPDQNSSITVAMKQKTAGWQSTEHLVAGTSLPDSVATTGNIEVKYTKPASATASGKIEIGDTEIKQQEISHPDS